MESALTNACTIKIQNFEGPFDLLFHLLEKNQVSIYDIPINEITDQYMEYLFAMQEIDLEIASEFLVMAATLLHIKSRMLLPEKKEKQDEETDPREELVLRLVEYKKFKEFSSVLKSREAEWSMAYYKLPDTIEYRREDEVLELSQDELLKVYLGILKRNKEKINPNTGNMEKIIQHEKISLKGKMKEILGFLASKTSFIFNEIFSLKKRSKAEVVTGFLALLELIKLKKIRVEQKHQFEELLIYRQNGEEDLELSEDGQAFKEGEVNQWR